MSLFDLTGKVAVITGSSRGIGRAIAIRMAQHGARVVVSSRKREACDAVVAEIRAEHGGGSAIALPANISAKDDLRCLIGLTEAELGPVDVLVCNAASNPYYGPLHAIADEQFRKILDDNVLSNHWLIQLVAPGMMARRDGSIIIVSSIGGLRGSPVIGAYGISKAADMQLARNYAVEYGPHNLRVNCICPGLVRTDFARAVGRSRGAPGSHGGDAAAAHRRARRHCGSSRLPGLRGRSLRDRASDRHRRRCHDIGQCTFSCYVLCMCSMRAERGSRGMLSPWRPIFPICRIFGAGGPRWQVRSRLAARTSGTSLRRRLLEGCGA